MKIKASVVAVASALGLAGCLGDNDQVTGVLLDSAVEGVSYTAGSGALSGTTDAQGRFSCQPGQKVTFKVGDVELGQADCAGTVTPLQLAGAQSLDDAKVANRLLLLQMLDEDDNPDNGIKVTTAMATALKGKALDFTKAAAAFDADLGAALPAGMNDAFGNPYAGRPQNAGRRQLARDHFEATLAAKLGKSDTSTADPAQAGIAVAITKHTLKADAALHVPYEGSNAKVKQDFPHGFFPAAGSGLAYKGKAADGSLEFYGITDRGPNGDAPTAPSAADPQVNGIAKVFPAPGFTPAIGLIGVGKDGAVLKSLMPIKVDANTRISGRPIAAGSVGASGETPLTEALTHDADKVAFDPNGLDPESLVYDARNQVFWTSDEYGPFIVKIDAATGVILNKYAPGNGAADLPAVLAQRRANRGMEGLAMDAAGHLHGFLQSPIDPIENGKSAETTDANDLDQDGKTTDKVKLKDYARFARWIEFDPATATSRLYAYPIDGALYDKNRPGNAKLGDLVAVGGGKFLVIEQGKGTDGKVHNYLMLVEIPAGATDIAALGTELEKNSIDATTAAATAWTGVVTLRKRLLLDLNAAGWLAEKAEGLALVDDKTIALINDNDFGLRSVIVDAQGQILAGSIEDCTVDASGAPVSGCPADAVGSRVTRGVDAERPTRLWLIKFPQALADYGVVN